MPDDSGNKQQTILPKHTLKGGNLEIEKELPIRGAAFFFGPMLPMGISKRSNVNNFHAFKGGETHTSPTMQVKHEARVHKSMHQSHPRRTIYE